MTTLEQLYAERGDETVLLRMYWKYDFYYVGEGFEIVVGGDPGDIYRFGALPKMTVKELVDEWGGCDQDGITLYDRSNSSTS